MCRGRGIPYEYDYRPGDWACLAGDPINPAVPIENITDASQLRPNGLAGYNLGKTQCNSAADLTIGWAPFDPFTLQPFTDLGVPIPGKWTGCCGAFIGPDPDELALWQHCGCIQDRMETCTFVPCTLNSQTSCQLPQACLNSGGFPHVYCANNHGTPNPDGTRTCDSSDSGSYTSDFTRFEDDNCFALVQCAISQVTGDVCNGPLTALESPPTEWVGPFPDPFFDD